MIIAISQNFTEEETLIISNLKGYSPFIPVGPGDPDIENPESREEFLRKIYDAMVKNDKKNTLFEHARIQRQESERLENDSISKNVDNSITSWVE